jgi:hypothetical protein
VGLGFPQEKKDHTKARAKRALEGGGDQKARKRGLPEGIVRSRSSIGRAEKTAIASSIVWGKNGSCQISHFIDCGSNLTDYQLVAWRQGKVQFLT